jgi:light-harvesting protein B-800-850 alpha chain
MNQGRIWTVVKPTVGLPLLLGSVTVIVILVHYAVLTHTSWYGKFLNGKTAAIETSVNIG